MLKGYGVKHRKSTPYYPQGNGQAEATNKTLLRILSKMVFEYEKGWSTHLPDALWAYHKQRQQAEENMKAYHEKVTQAYNRTVRERCFKEGDLVLKTADWGGWCESPESRLDFIYAKPRLKFASPEGHLALHGLLLPREVPTQSSLAPPYGCRLDTKSSSSRSSPREAASPRLKAAVLTRSCLASLELFLPCEVPCAKQPRPALKLLF
ncbi:hypothetical protein ACLB2K_053522 [Fragaria x ananassa]